MTFLHLPPPEKAFREDIYPIILNASVGEYYEEVWTAYWGRMDKFING